jgi:hypothetical protein
MHESLAAFVKGKLALAQSVQRRELASELEARTLALLDAEGSGGPDTALRLNGLIYIGSRLGDVWHDFLARLWQDHRDTVLRLSPEAFVTLLSGSSLLGLLAVEEAYLGLLPDQADLRRVLVGWHLVYFGDREKPSDLAFGREALVYGGDGDWSRTRARLEARMRSLESRDSLLFAFDAAAYLSCASLLSPETYGAAGTVVAEHLDERRLPPTRLSALRQVIVALDPAEGFVAP